MIVQNKESKSQPSLIDLLGGGTKKSSSAQPNDLFSKLLNSFGMQSKGTDAKASSQAADFKAVIDPKNSSSKNGALRSELQMLLSGSEKKDSALLSGEMLTTLSADQMRTLINRAKDYLKNEITAKNPEYQTDPKMLPKTLGGLVKLAEKLGLEPQSITFSNLIIDSEEKHPIASELLTKPLFDAKAIATTQSETVPDESPMKAITQLISELKAKEQKKGEIISSATTETTSEEKADTQPLQTLLQNLEKQELKSAKKLSASHETQETHPSKELFENPTTQETQTGLTNTIEKTALKKTSSAESEHKTDMLIALLHGTNESKESSTETSGSTKTEGISEKAAHALKADSLEVKTKEAQQSMRHFAADLKEAVQEYKPPFTRLSMKLNPEKLGEVEVTLVQRGNNVHVNIQSNNANSVAFLAHNATELKTQLAAQGIQNATMNFMSGQEGQNQPQSGQQQQNPNQQHRLRIYESFEELTQNEEQLSALEIIIPHYA